MTDDEILAAYEAELTDAPDEQAPASGEVDGDGVFGWLVFAFVIAGIIAVVAVL